MTLKTSLTERDSFSVFRYLYSAGLLSGLVVSGFYVDTFQTLAARLLMKDQRLKVKQLKSFRKQLTKSLLTF